MTANNVVDSASRVHISRNTDIQRFSLVETATNTASNNGSLVSDSTRVNQYVQNIDSTEPSAEQNRQRIFDSDNNLCLQNDVNVLDETKKWPVRCQVCGDAASKYIHYGGRSCQSCRAFFRRSVVKYARLAN